MTFQCPFPLGKAWSPKVLAGLKFIKAPEAQLRHACTRKVLFNVIKMVPASLTVKVYNYFTGHEHDSYINLLNTSILAILSLVLSKAKFVHK